MVKLDLCDACATKLEVTDVNAVAVEDLIAKIRRLQNENQRDDSPKCPRCQFSLNEYHRTGRMGCPECYEVFADELQETLEGCQKSLNHAGKIPEQARTLMTSRRLDELENELQAAIRNEQYETAARLRDRIREAREANETTSGA